MPGRLLLDDVHRAHGAVMEHPCGLPLPWHYGDVAAEYRALREGAGLADRSMAGKVVVTGRDRLSFLQGMLTNDVKSLLPGQGAPAAFLDAHGKVLALLVIYALEDRLWLEVPSGLTGELLQTLDKYLISEKASFEAADDAFAVLSLQGPRAAAVLSTITGRPLGSLAAYQHVGAAIGDLPVRLMSRADGHVPGFHCWTPAEHGPALWRALVAAGARPVGVEAWNVLRVEAGVPAYGHDVDQSVILPETRLEHLVSYTKGCYIGQEVVARVKYRGHVNRALTGLVLEGDRVPGWDARVLADGKEVGRLTSAVRSLALGRVIAMGYLRREHWEPGTAVTVRDGDALLPARVAALPFVRQA